MRLLATFSSFFVALTVVGCAAIPDSPATPEDSISVESFLESPEFYRGNHPERTLSVLVFVSDGVGWEYYITHNFNAASLLLQKQVGIKLDLKFVSGAAWKSKKMSDMMIGLTTAASAYPDYDIVIGVTMFPSAEEMRCLVVPVAGTIPTPGVADSQETQKICTVGTMFGDRLIVLHSIMPEVIMHEVGHVFGLGHSQGGTMKGLGGTKYFSVPDRKRFLASKWKILRPSDKEKEPGA